MDTIVKFTMFLWIVLFFIQALGYPFLIGKTKEGEYTAKDYLVVMFVFCLPVILIGRILSWW